MIDNDYFGHISPTYGSVGNMLRSFGVSFSVAGENLQSSMLHGRNFSWRTVPRGISKIC